MVKYKKEKENVVVTACPGGETDESTLLVVIAMEADWIDQVRSMLNTDEYFKDLNTQWAAGKLNPMCIGKKSFLL